MITPIWHIKKKYYDSIYSYPIPTENNVHTWYETLPILRELKQMPFLIQN